MPQTKVTGNAMNRYKVTAHVGIARPIYFLLWAKTVGDARAAADGPEDRLRARIEGKMTAMRVDPYLRGWHNYEVMEVEDYRGQAERLTDTLRAAGVTEDELEEALVAAILHDEVEPDEARDLYGTAQGGMVLARIRGRSEKVRTSRGYLGLVAALVKYGLGSAKEIRPS